MRMTQYSMHHTHVVVMLCHLSRGRLLNSPEVTSADLKNLRDDVLAQVLLVPCVPFDV